METQRRGSRGFREDQREAATSHRALEGQWEDSQKQKKVLNILIKGRAEMRVSGIQMGG